MMKILYDTDDLMTPVIDDLSNGFFPSCHFNNSFIGL